MRKPVTSVSNSCGLCGFTGAFGDFAGRIQVQCPTCGSLERHRKQGLYLRQFTELFTSSKPLNLLHIAPEPCFAAQFRARDNILYVSADLDPSRRGASKTNPITPADLTALPFADASFDAVICSHVLEHIPNDDDAMDEIRRVMRPDALAVLDVPLRHAATTYEDWSITTPEGRTAAFGQYDHVRFYGRDFFEKLRHAGIDAEEVDNFWGDNDLAGQQLGNWGIIVGRPVDPTPPGRRPAHNRPFVVAAEGESVSNVQPKSTGQPTESVPVKTLPRESVSEASIVRVNGDSVVELDVSGISLEQIAPLAELLPRDTEILVKGVDSAEVHGLALAAAASVNGSFTIPPGQESGEIVGYVTTPGTAPMPSDLDHPPRPSRMAADLPVESSSSLGNDYAVHIADARRGAMPAEPITVVIPVYNRIAVLEMTLRALTHQTYPKKLIDIVIADDGSSDSPDSLLPLFQNEFRSIRYVRQEDLGYRLSEVRNLGVNAATTELVILLDCDMAPVPRLVELFARHLHVQPRAIYCGHRRYVDANHLDAADIHDSVSPLLELPDIRPNNAQVTSEATQGPTIDWRVPIYQETSGLRFERHPFRAVCGGNIGFTKTLFSEAGSFDEDFKAWGGEDAEWGYRAWNRGHYIVPIIDACGLHLEPAGGRNETDREAGRKETIPLLKERCPVRFRTEADAGPFQVPLVSIYIPAYNAAGTIVPAIKSALNQTVKDLEVCVVDDGSTDGTYEAVIENFGTNPRVRIERQENAGIGAASNAAVRMCRGPFIGQLDSDDRLKYRAVQRLLKVLRSDPRIGVAYSSSELIDESGDRVGDSYEFPYYSSYDMLYGMIIHHFRLFRARDWYRTQGFATDITNAVDYDMFLKLAEVTEMVHLPAQLYQYRKHASSTSQAAHKTQRANHRLVVQRALDRRALSAGWRMVPPQPKDPRTYEFAPHVDGPRHFGRGADSVRLSIHVGWQREDAVATVQELFPGWKVETRKRRGEPRVESPPLSHARAIKAIENLAEHFPRPAIRLVYG